MEGCLGGLGAEPPAAEGQWGSGGEALSRRRLGVWGQSPQRTKILHFFAKKLHFRAILIIKIMLLKRGLEIGSANKIKLVAKMGYLGGG